MLANRHDKYIGQALIEYGEYSEIETHFLLALINRPGAIVEVGANIGSQTVAIAKAARAAGADVVAFEPQPFVFQNLCANLALNALGNVNAWPFACSDQPGFVWLKSQDYQHTGNFGEVSVQAQKINEGFQMPCVRLDDFLGGRDVYLMKIDVEGFELQVLQGARQILTGQRPMLYVENDRPALSTALIEHLWAQGYRLWWHIVPLFNPDNFRANKNNPWAPYSSFNMFGLPRESSLPLPPCGAEITDSSAGAHPMMRHGKP
jgi:FkbM family methyltransferase